MALTPITLTVVVPPLPGTSVVPTGSVRAVLSAPIFDAADVLSVPVFSVVRQLDATGKVALPLVANDDPTTQPTGTTWSVTLYVDGRAPVTKSVSLPHAAPGGTVDLSTLAPTTTTPSYGYVLAPVAPANGDTLVWNGTTWIADTVVQEGAVPLAGGTMTGELLLAGNPPDALGAVPKQYADGKVASVSAGDSTITVGGTATAPTVRVGAIAESQVTNLASDLAAKIPLTQKAAASGVASLDSTGNVPASQLGYASLGLTAQPTITAAATILPNVVATVDATAGAVPILLTPAPADRSRNTLKKIDTSANAVTLTCGGSDVFNKPGGGTTLTLQLANQAITVQYVASTGVWLVTGDDVPLSGLDARYPKAGGTIRMLTSGGTAPSSPATGDLWYDNTDTGPGLPTGSVGPTQLSAAAIALFDAAGQAAAAVNALTVITTEVDVSNTTAETSLCSFSFAANQLVVGSVYRLFAFGTTDNIATSGTLIFNLPFGGPGGTPSLGILTCTSSGTARTVIPWFVRIEFICLAVGSGVNGKVSGAGAATAALSGSGAQSLTIGAGIKTLDTTVSHTFGLTAQWATANVGNIIRCYGASLEKVH